MPLGESPAGSPVGNLHLADIGPDDYDLDGRPDPDLDGDELWDWILEAELIEERRWRECRGEPRSCGPWFSGDGRPESDSFDGFDESWAGGGESRDRLRLKLLYEAALSDPRIAPDALSDPGGSLGDWRVDLETAEAKPCDGWRLLVDLPGPAAGSDRIRLEGALSRMASAVRWVDAGTEPRFLPVRRSRRPRSLIPWGASAIEESLAGAHDWYRLLRAEGGAWEDDPLDVCRRWSVVLVASLRTYPSMSSWQVEPVA
jgi:hypothetical protein